MTAKILVLGKYYKLFIKEIPNYKDKPLILVYFIYILYFIIALYINYTTWNDSCRC